MRLAARLTVYLFAAFVASVLMTAAQSQAGGPLSSAAKPNSANRTAPENMRAQEQQAEAGLEAPWDVRQIVANVLKDDSQLEGVLNQIDPQQWYEKKGAPSTYILQLRTAHSQVRDVVSTAKLLDQKTEDLPLALDLYFRLEALEVTARAIEEGAERYSPRAISDKLNELIASNFNGRERLRDYLRDLATSTQQNFKIADEEAQRCRAAMSSTPATRKAKKY